MKKLILNFLLLFISLFLFQKQVMACDFEDKKVENLKIKTTWKLNIREIPCVWTKTFWTTKVWENFEVLAEALDYYKVLINWKERYIWKNGTEVFKEIEDKIDFENNDFESEIWKYWLSLYNIEREKLWLKPYIYNKKLEKSAQIWADLSNKRWYYSHKRDKNDPYYDFWKIQNWFKDNWIDCKIENRTWAVENIWYWVLFCKNWDCLEETKKVVKKTFDMYMSEKWKKNQSHYKSIISAHLNYMWFAISKKSLWNNRYWIYNVTHFCTNFKN